MKQRRAGFSLVETVIAMGGFLVVAYALVVTLDIGRDTEQLVRTGAVQNREIRAASRRLVDELRSSRDSAISVTTLADGNHELTFMVPIQLAGVNSWGVYDRSLGSDEASQNHEDWQIRYTVDAQGRLVRQLIDEQAAVQTQAVVAQLATSDAAPGFQVEDSGDVWVITITRASSSTQGSGEVEVFHVQTRNDD